MKLKYFNTSVSFFFLATIKIKVFINSYVFMYMTDVYHAKWHQYVFLNGNVNIFKSSQKSYFHNFTNLFLYIPGPLTV